MTADGGEHTPGGGRRRWRASKAPRRPRARPLRPGRRLDASDARRICIFEASRTRKGKLKNSNYRIRLPEDPRFVPSEYGPIKDLSEEAKETALYCGKVRSYNLSGANFIAYDDGVKQAGEGGGGGASGGSCGCEVGCGGIATGATTHLPSHSDSRKCCSCCSSSPGSGWWRFSWP